MHRLFISLIFCILFVQNLLSSDIEVISNNTKQNIDNLSSQLKYFIQDDLERHQKEKKNCIDFYQAWKKASNFNDFLDCLNSQNFIENNNDY